MAIDFKKEIIPDDSDKLLAFRGDRVVHDRHSGSLQ